MVSRRRVRAGTGAAKGTRYSGRWKKKGGGSVCVTLVVRTRGGRQRRRPCIGLELALLAWRSSTIDVCAAQGWIEPQIPMQHVDILERRYLPDEHKN